MRYLLLSLFLAVTTLGAIENSIIPVMEYYEQLQNLQPNHYSHAQFHKIEKGLSKKDEKIRIATYNMLFDLYDQDLAPENRWPARLPRIVELVNEMDPDVLGTQELEPNQVADLLPYLEDRYQFVSIDTDSGEQDGIFVKRSRFCILQKEIFEPVTMVELEDRLTGKKLACLNAHFSFSNVEARRNEAKLVAKKVRSIAKRMPVVFMGDLNTFPNRPDQTFPFLDGDNIDQILTKRTLQDSIDKSLVGHVGPIGTFTNNPPSILPFEGTGSPGVFLDHIYVSKGITVLIHAVQPATIDGHFPSDHQPVLIDCVIR